MNGIMVITDLSGFTKLTEAQSKLGDAGTELLTNFVNAYFSLFIKLTEAYGGDCIKFAGDALLCFVSSNIYLIFPFSLFSSFPKKMDSQKMAIVLLLGGLRADTLPSISIYTTYFNPSLPSSLSLSIYAYKLLFQF